MKQKSTERLAVTFLVLSVVLSLVLGVVALYSLNDIVKEKDRLVFDYEQRLHDAALLRVSAEKKVSQSRGFLITGDKSFLERMGAARSEFDSAMQRLGERITSVEGHEFLRIIREREVLHDQELQDVIELREKKQSLGVIVQAFENRLRPRRTALEKALDDFLRFEESLVSKARQNSIAEARVARLIIELATVAVGLLLIPLAIILWRNIRRAHQAEGRLERVLIQEKNSRDRFLDLVNQLDHSVVWEAVSEPFHFTFISERLQFLLGIPPKEVIQNKDVFFNYVHYEDRKDFMNMFQRAIALETDQRCDHRMLTIDRKEIWVQSGVHVKRNANGEHVFYGITMDITPLKHAQQRAEALQARVDTALQASDVGIFEYDIESREFEWSDSEARLFGFDAGVRVNLEHIFNRVHPDNAKSVRESFEESIHQAKSFRSEFRVNLPDGKTRWLLGVGTPILDKNKSAKKITGIHIDISSRKSAEDKIQQALTELNTFKFAMDASSIVSTTDSKGIITYVNDKFCQSSKYSREELIGQNHNIVKSSHHPPEFFKNLWDTISSGNVWQGDVLNRAKDGSYFWVQTSIVPFFRDGEIKEYMAIRTDITERKAAEETLARNRVELVRAKEAAEAASEAKTSFLANMSHEVRTPIGVIQGFADLLAESELDKDQMEWVNTIRRNSRQLASVVGEILDLTKVESEKLELEIIEFSLVDLVDDIRAIMSFKAAERGIELQIKVDDEIPPTITTDPTRFRQILINVVGNAIKFTEKGQVIVTFERSKINPEQLRVVIVDTGLGVTPEQQRRLFEPFVQGDSSMTRRFGGTGLGLSISKKLARALGGDLKLLSSNAGHGTIFELLVCCFREQSESPPPRLKSFQHIVGPLQLEGKRILVVEDSTDNQILIKRFLDRSGATVELAKNGREGVDKAFQNKVDLIIMDIQMPEMDGYEAVRILRARGFRSPVIALTAHALKEERDRAKKIGFDKYLTKPVTKSILMSAIAETLAAS